MSKANGTQYFTCSCFYSRNYFIPELGKHTEYLSRSSFLTDYGKILNEKKIDVDSVLAQVEKEHQRRLTLGEETVRRKETIQSEYLPKHPDIYTLKECYLNPAFIELVSFCKSLHASLDGLLQKMQLLNGAEKVYRFPVFSEEFCHDLVSELKHFEESDMPKGRPNTMNNDGILLDELGFDEHFMNPLRENYLNPLARILFPDEGGGFLDSHKAFIVVYRQNRDKDLDYHFDNAEVTLNVSLSGDFTDGSLYFGAMKSVDTASTFTECCHNVSHGVLHRGQHMHGAMPIADGERYNMIIWMRSSKVRNLLCPMCGYEPELVPTVGRGDGFTAPKVNVCNLT